MRKIKVETFARFIAREFNIRSFLSMDKIIIETSAYYFLRKNTGKNRAYFKQFVKRKWDEILKYLLVTTLNIPLPSRYVLDALYSSEIIQVMPLNRDIIDISLAIFAKEAPTFIKVFSSTDAEDLRSQKSEIEIPDDISSIVVPISCNGDHWCLVHCSLVTMSYTFLNPVPHQLATGHFYNLFNRFLKPYFDLQQPLRKLQIVNMKYPHRENSYDSGVFILRYAEQIIKQRPLSEKFDAVLYRHYLKSLIINETTYIRRNNCSLPQRAKNIFFKMGRDILVYTCDQCNRFIHHDSIAVLSSIKYTGRTFYQCKLCVQL